MCGRSVCVSYVIHSGRLRLYSQTPAYLFPPSMTKSFFYNADTWVPASTLELLSAVVAQNGAMFSENGNSTWRLSFRRPHNVCWNLKCNPIFLNRRKRKRQQLLMRCHNIRDLVLTYNFVIIFSQALLPQPPLLISLSLIHLLSTVLIIAASHGPFVSINLSVNVNKSVFN